MELGPVIGQTTKRQYEDATANQENCYMVLKPYVKNILRGFFFLCLVSLVGCGGGGGGNNPSNGNNNIGTTVPIQGTLKLSSENNASEYTLFNVYQEVTPTAEGNFSTSVSGTYPTVTFAISASGKKVYSGVTIDSQDSLTINAQSTAEALVFLNPLLKPANKEEYSRVLSAVKSSNAVKKLASLIESIYASVEDPLSDERILNATTGAVIEVLDTLQSSNLLQRVLPASSLCSTRSNLRLCNYDMGALTIENSSGSNLTLEPAVAGTFGIKTNVSWIAKIIELDPTKIKWVQVDNEYLFLFNPDNLDNIRKDSGFERTVIIEGEVAEGLLGFAVEPMGTVADLIGSIFSEEGIPLSENSVYAVIALSGSNYGDSAEFFAVWNNKEQQLLWAEARAINALSVSLDLIETTLSGAGVDVSPIIEVVFAGLKASFATDNPADIGTQFYVDKIIDSSKTILDYIKKRNLMSDNVYIGVGSFITAIVEPAKRVIDVWSGTISTYTRIGNFLLSVTPRESAFVISGTPWGQADTTESFTPTDLTIAATSSRPDIDTTASSTTIQITTPNTSLSYYTSENPYFLNGYGGQCTAFAWGRAYEKMGVKLTFNEGSTCYGNNKTVFPSAKYWIERNTTNFTWDNSPKADSIAVWEGDSSNPCGHVAYVEDVIGDTVYFNEANVSTYVDTNYGGGYDGYLKIRKISEMLDRGPGIGKLKGYLYLQPSVSVNPTLSISTDSVNQWSTSAIGLQGATFYLKGSGYTPSSSATSYITKPDGSIITSSISVDSGGNLSWSYTSGCSALPGSYTIYVTDSSGKDSGNVTETITSSSSCSVNPTLSISINNSTWSTSVSGPHGTTFYQKGSGFTPNSTATQYITTADGSTITGTVTVDASGNLSWSYMSTCTDPMGNVSIYVKDSSGANSNTVTETITSSSSCVTVNPTLSISTNNSTWSTSVSGAQGTTFYIKGSGFTPSSTATRYITKPDGSTITTNISVDSSGNLNWSYISSCSDATGAYTIYVKDSSDKNSGSVTETTTSSSSCSVNPTLNISTNNSTWSTSVSGAQGTTFYQKGSGFTPNSTATQYITKADGSTITGTVTVDASGNLSWSYTSNCTDPTGNVSIYVKDSSGANSNTVTETITSSSSCVTINPTLSISTNNSTWSTSVSGAQGTTFYIKGSGFTPSSTATRYIAKPDGSTITTNISVGSSGNFSWSYTSTCNDPTGAYSIYVNDSSGKDSGTVTETITSSTSCVTPISWEFNSTGNFEGWALTNMSSAQVNGGVLYLDPADADPYISGPNISTSAGSYRYVELKMASNALDGSGTIYFRTIADNSYSETKKVSFSVSNCSLCGNASYYTYTVDMWNNSYWTGTITGIRVDPANNGQSGTNMDTIGIDYIKLK